MAGRIRLALIDLLLAHKRIEPKSEEFAFVWVDQFPLLSPDEEDPQRLRSTHHPFTALMEEDFHLLNTNPEKVSRTTAWD